MNIKLNNFQKCFCNFNPLFRYLQVKVAFVRNLPGDVEEKYLSQLFSPYGQVFTYIDIDSAFLYILLPLMEHLMLMPSFR